MVRTPIAIIALSFTSAPALAQSATVTATHNHPTGLVQPGETVRISFSTTWTGAFHLAQHAGDAVASPDIGSAFSNGTGATPSPLVNVGTPLAGSVRGVDVASGPTHMFPPPAPFWITQPAVFLFYDWTAPQTPGVVEFDWVPHASVPSAMFYLTSSSVVLEPLPTTYIGTSLTVVPAPGGVVLLGLASSVVARRKR